MEGPSKCVDSDEDGCANSDEENLDIDTDDRLDITVAQAEANLSAAGTEVAEENDRISVAKHRSLVVNEIDDCLNDIVQKLAMPYSPTDFQRVSINALAQMKNVILVSPTGSGKMNVPLLATLVLRVRLNNPKGVCILTQPLTSIMNEKKQNDVCRVAVLSMSGQLSGSLEPEDATLSCLLDELLNGDFAVLIGHPESFNTSLGQKILRELQRRERIILVCIDEFHQAGVGQWDTFRPTMMKNSTRLRLYGIKDCPTISMTATATEEDVKNIVSSLGLRSDPIMLTSSPIQSHIKFSVVRRPSSNYGLDGTVNADGKMNPGLMDLLMRIYLKKYLEDLETGRQPKKCIIFSRGNNMLADIYCRLMELTDYRQRFSISPNIVNTSS